MNDLSGLKFGRLTVLCRSVTPSKRAQWNCLCECGKENSVQYYELVSGGTKSCGCLKYEVTANRNRKHGHTTKKLGPSPTYQLWQSIIRRCYYQRAINYHKYGAKGIRVCYAWRASFSNFLRDMGEKPKGLTIDRINNEDDYRPGNCRWATPCEQGANRRRSVINSSGEKNVHWHPGTRSWRVRVSMNGVNHGFGLYKNFDQARKAAIEGRKKVHKEFANHG